MDRFIFLDLSCLFLLIAIAVQRYFEIYILRNDSVKYIHFTIMYTVIKLFVTEGEVKVA